METLMDFVNTCPLADYDNYSKDVEQVKRKILELEELGFKHVAERELEKIDKEDRLARISKEGYRKISKYKIEKYLEAKVEKYNKEHEKSKVDHRPWPHSIGYSDSNTILNTAVFPATYSVSTEFVPVLGRAFREQLPREIESISKKTCDFWKTDENTIGQFIWTETPVERYQGIPPKNILEIFKLHKLKELFDYFTIAEVNKIKDPILLGRVKGCDDRFFIPGCQWGDDIIIDDLI